ncbi:KxDL motif-containing protein 1 [Coemansia sp. IMI 209128]|nr:KxDL motif-containing protein 1 [Coemansia sp. IMI 209128]
MDSTSAPQRPSVPSATTPLSVAVPGLPALDLSKTLDLQKQQLEIYRELLEALAASEHESATTFPELSKSLVNHIGTLHKLKEDLQDIFTRIRALKTHFRGQYPEIYDYVQSLHVDELEDEDEGAPA